MARLSELEGAVLGLIALGAGFAKVGTFGGQELKIGVSARATGMGSAFTGVSDDATAVVTGTEDHLLVWNLDTSTWADIACRAAGR